MKKKIFFSLLIITLISAPVFAEKIPVKLEPAQIISTKHDEIEVGDPISFKIMNDVYVGDKIYIQKGTSVKGIVDFVHNNGWAGDSAEIKLNRFITKNANGEKISIDYPINLTEQANAINCTKQYSANILSLLMIIRGSELYIEPDTTYFNLFIER